LIIPNAPDSAKFSNDIGGKKRHRRSGSISTINSITKRHKGDDNGSIVKEDCDPDTVMEDEEDVSHAGSGDDEEEFDTLVEKDLVNPTVLTQLGITSTHIISKCCDV
jgi:hypothetical protein